MAKTNTATQTATRGRGRPPKDESADPKEAALSNLQYAMDRACAFICDGSNSVVARAARCARAGVPEATVEKALEAMRAALSDAEAAVERAYAAPAAKPAVAQRVNLLG